MSAWSLKKTTQRIKHTSSPITSFVVKTRNVTDDIIFDKSVANATSVDAITTAVALFSTI
jgi:hypothetical protein